MSVKLLTYREHVDHHPLTAEEALSFEESNYSTLFKKRRGDLPCYNIIEKGEGAYHLSTGYFIGVDWIVKGKTALYVEPKLNVKNKDNDRTEIKEIDFINMLFSSLRHPEVLNEVNELFEVKWNEPTIGIEQKQDLLTPFLIVEFLGLLKNIVRKGLKKSYYKVEKNLHSRVKGKILLGKSIKHNLMQQKNLHTYCTYDEFGVDNKENRLLKKALVFVKRYLPAYARLTDHKELKNTFNYINPAFQAVSENIQLQEIKQSKTNAFYKDYEQAIRLAKLILRRFGYNISNTVKDKIETPPFWIDMSKLFELYVLGLLKDRFHGEVRFQVTPDRGNEIDYLLKSAKYKMVIDAKYKTKYITWHHNDDIRQVSGYARLRGVYDYFYEDRDYNKVVDCLIVYPDQEGEVDDLLEVKLKEKEVDLYYGVYKVGVRLPVVGSK